MRDLAARGRAHKVRVSIQVALAMLMVVHGDPKWVGSGRKWIHRNQPLQGGGRHSAEILGA